ncbi:hypothetical protein Ga0466249_002871 [Sporomusaceae bacterium BoRhaA]|nr:hypothetical protein [Pelorhabdus rhamnosifermentans]
MEMFVQFTSVEMRIQYLSLIYSCVEISTEYAGPIESGVVPEAIVSID